MQPIVIKRFLCLLESFWVKSKFCTVQRPVAIQFGLKLQPRWSKKKSGLATLLGRVLRVFRDQVGLKTSSTEPFADGLWAIILGEESGRDLSSSLMSYHEQNAPQLRDRGPGVLLHMEYISDDLTDKETFRFESSGEAVSKSDWLNSDSPCWIATQVISSQLLTLGFYLIAQVSYSTAW